MKVRLLLIGVLAAMTAIAAPPAFADGTTSPAPRYYLALGDSLSVGFQPNSNGTGIETDRGYTNRLFALEAKRIKKLQLVEMGCPGDTTTSLLTGSGNAQSAQQFRCNRKGGSQLKAAVSFLKKHHRPGTVPLITIDIGANDVDRLRVGREPVGDRHVRDQRPERDQGQYAQDPRGAEGRRSQGNEVRGDESLRPCAR